MDEIIIAFLLEHSPSDSGPAYLAIARHWDTISMALLGLFGLLFILSVWFAVSSFTSFDD